MKMVKKPVERVMSDKSMKLGNSFQGFLYGVCLTSLFFLTLTSFGRLNLTGISFSAVSSSASSSSQTISNMVTSIDSKLKTRETLEDNQVNLLVSAWEEELLKPKKEVFLTKLELQKSDIPDAPHFENCKLSTRVNTRFDSRIGNQTFPPWKSPTHPPWINGADEENYPLTRKVQRDIWIHQHPLDCMKPSVKFLVADWETLPSLGLGAQIVAMTGLLAIAIKENRVLVTKYYNRADHKGCRGESHATWSCYFFSETSQECRQRVSELIRNKEAWETGILMGKHNYSSKKIWSGTTPSLWGEPWNSMQPTTEINGSFVKTHRKMDRRWWKAQAVRYLMRFQTEYTCGLMNTARNAAFGREAAKNVLSGVWSKGRHKKSEMEEYVWSSHKPWIPRPLLSVHVRMGDKASEMTIVSFEEYMRLADRIRSRFPHLNTIWLSTEMQEVVERIKEYPHWRFYYTEVERQVGNKSMAAYESSLGRETSTNYPLVNFLMASEADFFTGALGSTWCFLIDGMRNTGGKVMSGYLSVNKHRFW